MSQKPLTSQSPQNRGATTISAPVHRLHHSPPFELCDSRPFALNITNTNMSSNVGLTTPRGTGTSGYVQRNLAHLRPRDHDRNKPYSTDLDSLKHRQRQPDKEILEHDRKREVEVKVFELRDKLEDEGYVPLLLSLSPVLRHTNGKVASTKRKSRHKPRR